MRKSASFTLVELVVAIGIIALMSVAIGVTLTALAPNHLDAQTRKVAAALVEFREFVASHPGTYPAGITPPDYEVRLACDPDAGCFIKKYQGSTLLQREALSLDQVVQKRGGVEVDGVIFKSPSGGTIHDEITEITLTYKNRSRELLIYPETGFIEKEL